MTPSTVLSVADEMSLTAPGLMALRSGDRAAIRAHGNLFLEAFGASGPSNYAQLARAVGLEGAGAAPGSLADAGASRRKGKRPAAGGQPNRPTPVTEAGVEPAKSEGAPARPKRGGAKAKSSGGDAPAGTLSALISAAAARGASAYEALSEAGHLRSASEFVPREGEAA